jgi:hypothetical protein
LEYRASNLVSIKKLNATETSATAFKIVGALYSSENEED